MAITVHATPSPMLRDPVSDARIWVGSRARTILLAGIVQRGRLRPGKIAALKGACRKRDAG
jgi:hypothetical protein